MKKVIINYLVYVVFFVLLANICIGKPTDNTAFTIVKVTQSLRFFQKDGQLQAELQTKEIVRSNSKTGGRFKKVVYYDHSSEITKIAIFGRKMAYIASNDLPTDEIFHSDSKFAYVEYTFAPKSRDLEIETHKVYRDFKLIDLLKFQHHEYETLDSEIQIEIPEWLDCGLEKFNFNQHQIVETTQNIKGGKLFIYSTLNLPAKDKLVGVKDARSFLPHIITIPKYMVTKNVKQTLLPDFSQLYNWYNSLTKEIGNDPSGLKPLVESLTKDKPAKEEKIKAIYYYVQDNIKYIAFEHGIMAFKPDACQNVFKNKYGDCKGMANLTKEMLVLAGIDARLTWIGTAGIPYSFELPSLYINNHMICTVVDGNNYLFLDPTEKNNDVGFYADRIQGREVLIQNGESYIKTVVPIQDNGIHGISQKLQLNIENNVLTGTGVMTVKGNNKTSFASYIYSSSEKNRTEAIESYISGNDKNIVVKSSNNDVLARDTEHSVQFAIKVENQIINYNKEKYVNLEFEKTLLNMNIEENRKIPFQLNRRLYKSYTTELSVPDGYNLKYLPPDFEEKNMIGDFSFTYQNVGDKIVFNKKIVLKELEIKPEYFGKWKTFMSGLKDFYNDQIILEKQ